MSGSPYQFVPSTPCIHMSHRISPCIHMSHRISDWSNYNSPAAVVPVFTETQEANNNRNFATQTAIVPRTPNFQAPMNLRCRSQRSGAGIIPRSPCILSPKIGQCAEQIVPSTPQGTTCGVSCDSGRQTNSSQMPNLSTPKLSRREAILKQRRSPKPATRARNNATELFSDNHIFS